MAGILFHDCWKLLIDKKILNLGVKRIDKELVTALWPAFCAYAIVKLLEVILLSLAFELIIGFRRAYRFVSSRV